MNFLVHTAVSLCKHISCDGLNTTYVPLVPRGTEIGRSAVAHRKIRERVTDGQYFWRCTVASVDLSSFQQYSRCAKWVSWDTVCKPIVAVSDFVERRECVVRANKRLCVGPVSCSETAYCYKQRLIGDADVSTYLKRLHWWHCFANGPVSTRSGFKCFRKTIACIAAFVQYKISFIHKACKTRAQFE